MAKKIFKGIGGMLGMSKKKKAPVEETGPKITQLNPADVQPKQRGPRRQPLGATRGDATLLSDKLG